MAEKIDVLDRGFVRLVDHMGSDASVVRAARVSYNGDRDLAEGEDGAEKDRKLIHYLMKNRHTSPFEAVTFTFEVKAPIFVFRQWHRHRTFSYNEISARYTELDEGFYLPDVAQITTQATGNKQMRTGEQHESAALIRDMIDDECARAYATYQSLLVLGAPRELARSVLPVAAYSRMFCTVNLHNLFHFIGLRSHSHAQYEIRVYSDALLALITAFVPVSVEAFLAYRMAQ